MTTIQDTASDNESVFSGTDVSHIVHVIMIIYNYN